jgi:photosystem II stability/assembly factor-like uncharacterized protein
MRKIIVSIFLLKSVFCTAQVQLLQTGVSNSFRGLSVVNDSTFWVSGNKGLVGYSNNFGKSFTWISVPGFSQTDFRDIHAFSPSTAIIMGIDSPAYILKTTDYGKNWKKQYQNNSSGIFLDAMDFFDEENGIIMGDPQNGKMFFLTTKNGGETWKDKTEEFNIIVTKGEAAFASSGSNIKMISRNKFVAITGGLGSSLIRNGKIEKMPIIQGKETTGANALAMNGSIIIVVGGDFNTKDSTNENCVIRKGKKWLKPAQNPNGYRSCIEHINGKTWITCGLNGVDISKNGGETFEKISDLGFHACKKGKNGKIIYFSGGQGKIAILKL